MRSLFLCLAAVVCSLPAVGVAQFPGHDPNFVDGCFTFAIADIEVPAEEAGVLKGLDVEEGDLVEQGEVVGQIDDSDAQILKEIALAAYYSAKERAEDDISIRYAKKASEVAKVTYEKAEAAIQENPNALPANEVRRLLLDWERSVLQIEASELERKVSTFDARSKLGEYHRAEMMIGRRQIKSPVNGRVEEVKRRPGEWVAAGDPVLRVIQMDRLRVHGKVRIDDHAPTTIQNRPVEIEIPLTGGKTVPIKSKIGFASWNIEPGGMYRVWAEFDNQRDGDKWLISPGMKATMRLSQ